jgi:hypothetical protein
MSTQTVARPHASSKFHHAAAAAYELAADHHRKAAQHHDRGDSHEANVLAASARIHARTGDEQAQKARQHMCD